MAPRYQINDGRQVSPYAPGSQAPATNGAYYATYGGQQIAPYGAPQQGASQSPWSRIFGGFGQQQQDKVNREKELAAAAQAAGGFAGQGEAGYGAMTAEMAQDRQALRALAEGKNSIAQEQLRQGMQSQYAAQQSMAAGASPQNSVMAARTAMNNVGRANQAMAGQAAMAGIAERNAAVAALAQMNAQQRGQDIEVGLGSRQNQLTGLGANKPDKPKSPTTGDKIMTGVGYGLSMFSDERLKIDVKDGDDDARRALEVLSSKTYKYKDPKYGEGKQLGVMAQALERAGLKQAVIDTPEGKAINVGKLTGANTSMLAALAKRVGKLEGKR